MAPCPKCSKEIDPATSFCPHCGAALAKPVAVDVGSPAAAAPAATPARISPPAARTPPVGGSNAPPNAAVIWFRANRSFVAVMGALLVGTAVFVFIKLRSEYDETEGLIRRNRTLLASEEDLRQMSKYSSGDYERARSGLKGLRGSPSNVRQAGDRDKEFGNDPLSDLMQQQDDLTDGLFGGLIGKSDSFRGARDRRAEFAAELFGGTATPHGIMLAALRAAASAPGAAEAQTEAARQAITEAARTETGRLAIEESQNISIRYAGTANERDLEALGRKAGNLEKSVRVGAMAGAKVDVLCLKRDAVMRLGKQALLREEGAQASPSVPSRPAPTERRAQGRTCAEALADGRAFTADLNAAGCAGKDSDPPECGPMWAEAMQHTLEVQKLCGY